MKKSKVIIPAMALLLFSTAASVTGTVAWFTSTRVFTSSVASFGINAVEDNLKATVAPRVGTKLDSEDNTKIVAGSTKTGTNPVDVPNRLYHGSFDATTTKAWILNPDRDGTTNNFDSLDTEAEAYTAYHGTGDTSADSATGNKWLVRKNATTMEGATPAEKTYNYYVAFSWSVEFSYTFGGTAQPNVAIFLDLYNSNISVESTPIRDSLNASGSGKNTGSGFRIAFYPVGESDAVTPGNANARVFGKNGTRTYISSSTATLVGDASYAADIYNTQIAASSRRPEGTSSAAAAGFADTICTIAKPAEGNEGTKKVICVAWFEGTDSNVITEAVMDSVKAQLTFYARNIVTA